MKKEEILLLQYGPKINGEINILPVKISFGLKENMVKSFDESTYDITISSRNDDSNIVISTGIIRSHFENPNKTLIPVRPGMLSSKEDLDDFYGLDKNNINKLYPQVKISLNNSNIVLDGDMICLEPIKSKQQFTMLLEYCYVETALIKIRDLYVAL